MAEVPYLPRSVNALDGRDVGRFLVNHVAELREVPFDEAERAYLADPKILGRVLDPAARPFLEYHLGASVARVARALLAGRTRPRLLELGCGSGSVALLLALAGARVVGVDLSPVAVGACRKRQAYYEERCGPLDLELHAADAFAFPFADHGPFDGVYSVFAFNLMQPTAALLDRVVPTLAPGGLLVLADGNQQSVLNRLARRRPALTPAALCAAVEARGLVVRGLRFGGLIPAPLAGVGPARRLAEGAERHLAATGLLRWVGASYTLVAAKER